MINGLVISSWIVLFVVIVGFLFELYMKGSVIKKLNKELEEEYKYREGKDDSIAGFLAEELSVTPGKRRLCYNCEYGQRPWYFKIIVNREGPAIYNPERKINPNDIDSFTQRIDIPIYDPILRNTLQKVAGSQQ